MTGIIVVLEHRRLESESGKARLAFVHHSGEILIEPHQQQKLSRLQQQSVEC